MKKITIFIIVASIIAGAAGFYYYQKNSYSKEVLKLEILGPEKAELLEEVEYVVKYKNNGNVRLEDPELTFRYPGNAVLSEGGSYVVEKKAEELGGAIYPGEEKSFHFKARLLGQEGEANQVEASVEYRAKNLKASYESATTFTTIISKVPFTFEFDLPSEIESGKKLNFSLNYFSNTNYPLSDLRVSVDYPQGFEFLSSSPSALAKKEWDIGLINKAEGGRIDVSGKISGEISEEKLFHAKIGIWKDGEFILLKEIAKGITITKPSLYISQQINGNPEYIATPGDMLHYQISFKNIGENLLNNLFLIVKLDGKSFNLREIKAPRGEFETGDNSIIFDWKRVPSLQFLDSGDEGKVEFWVRLKDEWGVSGAEDKNPEIKSNIYLSQAKEEFVNRVNSKMAIEQKAFYKDGVFKNSGPIPPESGETTTYTVSWKVKNFYNDVKNAKVKASLPENLKLTGEISPDEESSMLAFDSNSKEIVWNIGDLKMSEGIGETPAPTIFFQVEFTPSKGQIGSVPKIINEVELTGQDQWTKEEISAEDSGITTALPDDNSVSEKDGVVH